MSGFFREYFFPYNKNSPEGEDKAFHSLYQLVMQGGGGAYRIVFKLSVMAAILFLGLSIIFFVMSSYGRVRDENKAKVQRSLWVCIGIGAAAGLVAIIFGVFAWNTAAPQY